MARVSHTVPERDSPGRSRLLPRARGDAQWGRRVEERTRHGLPRRTITARQSSSAGAGEGGGGPSPPHEPEGPDHQGEEDVDIEDKPLSSVPRRYKVIFHDDDYTTMEFVVDALKRFFHKTDAEAVHIMLTVHKIGSAVAGVYTRDVAETKAEEVMTCARDNGMPLLLTTEPE